MEADIIALLVTKLVLSVHVAVWIREPGSGPPTHVRANSEPSPTKGPGKPSQARGAPHTDDFGSLELEPSRARKYMGTCCMSLPTCVTCTRTFSRIGDVRNVVK
jgi:hypothetical protein